MKFLESAPERYDRGIQLLSRGRIADIYERIADYSASPGNRVLDVGCGTGGVALACAARGAHVVAIDSNAGMLEVARAKPVPFGRVGDIEWLELGLAEIEDRFGETTLDAIVFCLVFGELSPARIRATPTRCPGRLADSSLNWTVLGCAPSMELFFGFIRGHVMTVPGGGPPSIPTLSPSDLGTIAAQAVVREDLSGMHFRVPGSRGPVVSRGRTPYRRRLGQTRSVQEGPACAHQDCVLPPRMGFPVPRVHLLGPYATERIPSGMAAEVPKDHRRLLGTFDFVPTTLEQEARRREHHG